MEVMRSCTDDVYVSLDLASVLVVDVLDSSPFSSRLHLYLDRDTRDYLWAFKAFSFRLSLHSFYSFPYCLGYWLSRHGNARKL